MSYLPQSPDERSFQGRSSDAEGWGQEIPEVEPVLPLPPMPPEVVPISPNVLPTVPAVGPERLSEGLGDDFCWHCGGAVGRNDRYCPWCTTQLQVVSPVPAVLLASEQTTPGRIWSPRPLVVVLIGYGLVLATIIASAVVLFLKLQDIELPWNADRLPARDLEKLATLALQQMLLASIGSSLVVVGTWIAAGPIGKLPEPGSRNRLLAWVLGTMLMLPALLIINIVYSTLIEQLLGNNHLEVQLLRELSKMQLFWILLTVEPAIFEELFFRYLLLGTLYDALRGGGQRLAIHLSVLLSSIMFAVAHLGQPLNIPYLVLVGLVLGYLRLASGSLALPMLLHFLHNAAVLVIANFGR